MEQHSETVTITKKGDNFQITVQHDQSGSAYGMDISKDALLQLREHLNDLNIPCDICGMWVNEEEHVKYDSLCANCYAEQVL